MKNLDIIRSEAWPKFQATQSSLKSILKNEASGEKTRNAVEKNIFWQVLP